MTEPTLSIDDLPPFISKRNEIEAVETIIEDAWPQLPEKYRSEELRRWMVRLSESIVRRTALAFQKATERGIQQAAALVCDPDFAQHRRERRKAWRDQMKAERDRRDADRRERMQCPTQEQIIEQLQHIEREIEYHCDRLKKYQAAKERLQGYAPKNVRLMPEGTTK